MIPAICRSFPVLRRCAVRVLPKVYPRPPALPVICFSKIRTFSEDVENEKISKIAHDLFPKDALPSFKSTGCVKNMDCATGKVSLDPKSSANVKKFVRYLQQNPPHAIVIGGSDFVSADAFIGKIEQLEELRIIKERLQRGGIPACIYFTERDLPFSDDAKVLLEEIVKTCFDKDIYVSVEYQPPWRKV